MSEKFVPNFEFLDDEERLIENLDPATALPEAEKQAAIARFRKAAKEGVSKMISLRLDSNLLDQFKARAAEEGLPYQTLIQSVVARYVNGTLVDVHSVKEIVKALSVDN